MNDASLDIFALLDKMAAQRLQQEQKRKQQLEKLQRCLESSIRQIHTFLDDPQRIQDYNDHVDTIIKKYDKWEDRSFEAFKIDPLKTEELKSLAFTAQLDDETFTASVSPSKKCIFFNPDAIDASPDDKIKKAIKHEVLHVFAWYQGGLELEIAKKINPTTERKYTEELSADSFSDHVQIWPLYSSRLKDIEIFEVEYNAKLENKKNYP